MTDEAAPETRDDQPPHAGTDVARRTPTDNWLSKQTGVEVIDTDDGRMIRLSTELATRVNLLVPISQIVQVNKNWTPVPRIVTLQPGVDTYKQGWDSKAKDEIHALRATGLRKIADLMGIQHVNTAWGKAPDTDRSIKATVTARVRGADGLWIYTTKAKTIRFNEHQEKLKLDALEKWEKYNGPDSEDARAGKAKPKPTETDLRRLVLEDMEHIDAKAETKAWNRCIRELAKVVAILKRDLAKPFLTIAYQMTPDMNDPHAMDFVRLQYETGSAALFGGPEDAGDAIAQIAAGEQAPALPPEGHSFVADGHLVGDEDDDWDDDEPPPGTDLPDNGQEPIEGSAHDLSAATGSPQHAPQKSFDTTATAIDDDWGDGESSAEDQGPAFPKPQRHMKLPKGDFEGKDIEEVVMSPAGRAYLAGRVGKLREENRDLVLDWLSWAADEDVTVENAVQLFGGGS